MIFEKTYGLDAINEIAATVAKQIEHKVVIVEGPMGAGKTTFIKAICKELGITETISSPTFSLINMYQEGKLIIYHFDCYRINNAEEALDFGAEEYLNSNDYCFVEWADRIESLLPKKKHVIKISSINDTTRAIEMQ